MTVKKEVTTSTNVPATPPEKSMKGPVKDLAKQSKPTKKKKKKAPFEEQDEFLHALYDLLGDVDKKAEESPEFKKQLDVVKERIDQAIRIAIEDDEMDRESYLDAYNTFAAAIEDPSIIVATPVKEKKKNSGNATTGMVNAYSRLSAKLKCDDCEKSIPRYPGRYPKSCPFCQGGLSPAECRACEDADVKERSILDEIEKRKDLKKAIEGLDADELDVRTALKAMSSALTRVIIEDEKNGGGLLEAVMPGMLHDMTALVNDHEVPEVIDRFQSSFLKS